MKIDGLTNSSQLLLHRGPSYVMIQSSMQSSPIPIQLLRLRRINFLVAMLNQYLQPTLVLPLSVI